ERIAIASKSLVLGLQLNSKTRDVIGLLSPVCEARHVIDECFNQASCCGLPPSLQHRRDALSTKYAASCIECFCHTISQKQHHVAVSYLANKRRVSDAFDQANRGPRVTDKFGWRGLSEQVHIVMPGAGQFEPSGIEVENGINERD